MEVEAVGAADGGGEAPGGRGGGESGAGDGVGRAGGIAEPAVDEPLLDLSGSAPGQRPHRSVAEEELEAAADGHPDEISEVAPLGQRAAAEEVGLIPGEAEPPAAQDQVPGDVGEGAFAGAGQGGDRGEAALLGEGLEPDPGELRAVPAKGERAPDPRR